MIGVLITEDNTFIEFYPIFTDHRKFGFRVKLPFHFGCRRSGEYGVAWSGFRMWTMWGNSGYPRNPFYVFYAHWLKHRIKKLCMKINDRCFR